MNRGGAKGKVKAGKTIRINQVIERIFLGVMGQTANLKKCFVLAAVWSVCGLLDMAAAQAQSQPTAQAAAQQPAQPRAGEPVAQDTPPADTAQYLSVDQLKRMFDKAYQNFRYGEGASDAPTPADDLTAAPAHPDAASPSRGDTQPAATPATTTAAPTAKKPETMEDMGFGDVNLIPAQAEHFHTTEEEDHTYLPLAEVRLNVSMENTTVREVVAQVLRMAEPRTGPWQVKWLLKDDDRYLLNERINLTAETDFGSFMAHLVDKINNLTGIQLTVKVFDVSRVLVISDSY